MNHSLNLEQRFALQRARYEAGRMSKPALVRTLLRVLRSRMLQKNYVQQSLLSAGIVMKIDELQGDMPEIISEETFGTLLEFQLEDSESLPADIDDIGWEDDDLEDDGLMIL